MSAPLDLPIALKNLTPEELNWLLVRSAATGKSTDEVVREIVGDAAKSELKKPAVAKKAA